MTDELELCIECDCPTGRAGDGDDSLNVDGHGPLCQQCFDAWHAEREKIVRVANDFCREMKQKLLLKHSQGQRGWDIDTFIDSHRCERMLIEHVRRLCHGQRQEIDIANLAMFIWAREGRR